MSHELERPQTLSKQMKQPLDCRTWFSIDNLNNPHTKSVRIKLQAVSLQVIQLDIYVLQDVLYFHWGHKTTSIKPETCVKIRSLNTTHLSSSQTNGQEVKVI